MSWHFSRVLGEAYLGANSLDGEQSAPLNGTDTHGTFWSPDKMTDALKPSRSGMTFRPLTENLGAGLLTWYLEDSRARIFHAPEKEQELMVSEAVCGNTWRESSVKYCRNTSSWKTHQCLWEEALPSCSLTLPRWGMTRSGVLWERITPPPLTSGTESGSWLTPRASDTGKGENPETFVKRMGDRSMECDQSLPAQVRRRESWATPTTMDSLPPKSAEALHKEATQARPGRSKPANLRDQVSNAHMWPTPNQRDWKDSGATQGNRKSPNLGTMVHQWATPCAGDYRSPNLNPCKNGQKIEPSSGHALPAQVGGQLNPTWVEWLMGWPLGWTDCAASVTDKFRLWLNSHGIH